MILLSAFFVYDFLYRMTKYFFTLILVKTVNGPFKETQYDKKKITSECKRKNQTSKNYFHFFFIMIFKIKNWAFFKLSNILFVISTFLTIILANVRISYLSIKSSSACYILVILYSLRDGFIFLHKNLWFFYLY